MPNDERMAVVLDFPRLRELAQASGQLERVDTEPNDRDKRITPAHLLDGCLSDLAHCESHAARLTDDDVEGDEGSMAHNIKHLQEHLSGAQDHAVRLCEFLCASASDPKEFASESERLQHLRRVSVKQEPDPPSAA